MLTRIPQVLVIDDSDDDLELLNAAVSRASVDWTVRSAKNFPDVIGLISSHDRHADNYRPDLIVLDLNLGATSGLGVLRWLRGHDTTRTVPIAILTGSKNPDLMKLAKEYGSTLVVEKSLTDMATVIRVINYECLRN